MFIHHTQELIFGGNEVPRITTNPRSSCQPSSSYLASVQTASGTGAHYLGAQFLVKSLQPRRVWIPDSTSDNHEHTWNMAIESMGYGTLPAVVRHYPYYNSETHSLDFDGMMRALEDAQSDDVLLLYACAHSPTGIDPTRGQWKAISEICTIKRLFPFFDLTSYVSHSHSRIH